MTKSRGINAPKRHWPVDEKLWLEVMYPDTPNQDLAARLGLTLREIYNAAKRFRLLKSAAFLASPKSGRLDGVRGAATRFKRGCPPPFGTPMMKGSQLGAEFRFKKGQKPANQQEVGALRINSLGDLDIKVAPGKNQWVSMRRYCWEQERGPIPPGMCVLPWNGDGHDTRIENLRLVTRTENIRINLLAKYPKELRNVMALRGRLKTQISRSQEAAHG